MITKDNIEAAAWCNADVLDIEKTRGLISNPTNIQGFIDGIDWFKKNLWHDGSEEPEENGVCLVYVSYEYEDYPEDNYFEYTTATWKNADWTEDHFSSEADVTILKWCYVKDLI